MVQSVLQNGKTSNVHVFLVVQASLTKVLRILLDCEIWGRQWLAENTQLVDCPTDKNLGTALLTRDAYDSLALRSLDASYIEIDHA